MKKSIVLLPKLSEKTYAMSAAGLYVFTVDTDLNKHEVAEAVENTYNVTVTGIRSVTVKGKTKRQYQSRKYVFGTRSDVKKMYVQLKEGDTIPVFAAVEEPAPVEKAEKKPLKTKKEK